jgi:hypothetical protein
LKNEVNRLKGEQGKPEVKPDKKRAECGRDISSESERKSERGKKRKKRKKRKLEIHETICCRLEKAELPGDAVFKGYLKRRYQGLKIEPYNVLVKREAYYSPSLKKTIAAEPPPGYDDGGYTPELKALLAELKFRGLMTEPKILEFLSDHGIQITSGTISNLLLRMGADIFIDEKKAIFRAGLAAAKYQQTDTTGAREHGKNLHSHIFCNDLCSVFFTRERQDRATVIDLLREDRPRFYLLNNEAFALFKAMRVPAVHISEIGERGSDAPLDQSQMERLLANLLTPATATSRKKIMDAAYIAGYHAENPIRHLLTDDASQYDLIARCAPLCWIHDGRHYKKLNPIAEAHVRKLDIFRKKYWTFYKKLLKYKKNPSAEKAALLRDEFKTLFSTVTGYDALDDRISKTKAKSERLLLVLQHPFLPLHNNESELGARVLVRLRDISLHSMSRKGSEVRDAFLTIFQTAKKMGVVAHSYILNRIRRSCETPSLASLIRQEGCVGFR